MSQQLDYPVSERSKLRHAAELANSALLTRRHIDSKILFTTINWKDLISDQLESNPDLAQLKQTTALLDNDKKIIDVINELIKTIDRQRDQQQTISKSMADKNKFIKSLEAQIQALKRDQITKEKLINEQQAEINTLNSRVNSLTNHNKLQAQDLKQMKNWSLDIEKKYQVHMNKKTETINDLKKRLTTRVRNIPSSIEYGTNKYLDSMIFNNIPSIQNTTGIVINNPNLMRIQTSLENEGSELSNNLTVVLDSLARENYKLTKLIQSTREYFEQVNDLILELQQSNVVALKLPKPVDIPVNVEIDSSTLKEYFRNLQAFEEIAPPITNEIYKLYDNILILDKLTNNSKYDEGGTEKLQNELEIMTSNWKDALNTADQWKQIADKLKHQKN